MQESRLDTTVSYEQFREEWIAEFKDPGLSQLDKGRRFGAKLITQHLGITTDDEDFYIADGPRDGGIDLAYLQRTDAGDDAQGDDSEGDTWFIVQSKYGTAYEGSKTILDEGLKVIGTLTEDNQSLSEDAKQILSKIKQFQSQATASDSLVYVIATVDPISQDDREMLDVIKIKGKERLGTRFDVDEVSVKTIWEELEDAESTPLSVPVAGRFVEQSSGLLVGTVSLMDLFEFLRDFQRKTGNLDQIYERNVRQFLGGRRKVNKAIANTLEREPEKFGLYNNGITIVVSNYDKQGNEGHVLMNDPYIVNGCQTTRTIWQVLDAKLNAGGTGSNTEVESWKEKVARGGLVTKIVRSDEAEILKITKITNSQNTVREQDFVALDQGFRNWADVMKKDYDIFLEIQRGGITSRKAYEKQHPEQDRFDNYVNAFDLIKAYGAGWLGVPGTAFRANSPFLPKGAVFEQMVDRRDDEEPFGAKDLFAAYRIKSLADEIGFGRNAEPRSRRQSRFLFYHLIMRMLADVIVLTPELQTPVASPSILTDSVIKLTDESQKEAFDLLGMAAITLVDQYLTVGGDNSAHKEISFQQVHNGDLNGFLKADGLGKENHSPLLVQALKIQNAAFGMSPGRQKVASALMQN